jgi:hypothetical protein
MAEVDGGDIVIRIRGDASDLEDAVTRSQGAISGLESGAGDAADVLGDMGSAAKKTKVDLKSMSGEGIGAVAAGLSTVNPQAGALVGLFGQLRVVSGPLALAIGAVAAALAIFEQHQAELDRQREISKAVADSLRDVELRLRDAYEDTSVAAGKLSRAELDILRVRRAQFKENLPAVKAINAEISEQVMRVEKAKGALEDLNPAQRNFAQLNEVLTTGLAEESAQLLKLQTQRDNTVAQMKEITSAKIEEIELTHQQAAADRDAGDAAEERAAAVAASMDALNAQSAAINAEVQAGIDQAIAYMEQAILEIEAAIVRDQEAIGAGISDSLSAVSSLSSTLSDQMVDDNKKAAKRLHRTSQAAGLANVAISTSVAIMKALAELGPIAGAVASVGIGLTGAAQAAAIAAQPPPSAHIGSGMPGSRDPLAPDERMSGGRRILSTEASGPGGVANSMGTQLLNDVNTGRVQSSGQITAVIGRTHLDQELFRSGRRGTSRYARALRTNPHPKPQGGY